MNINPRANSATHKKRVSMAPPECHTRCVTTTRTSWSRLIGARWAHTSLPCRYLFFIHRSLSAASLSAYAHTLVILMLFATWCTPARPMRNALADESMRNPKQKPSKPRASSKTPKRRTRTDEPEGSSTASATTSAAGAAEVTCTTPSIRTHVSCASTTTQTATKTGTNILLSVVPGVAVLGVAVLVLMMLSADGPPSPVSTTNACACATTSYNTLAGSEKRLVGSLLRQREGVNGMQVQTNDARSDLTRWLTAQAPCVKVVEYASPLTSTKALGEALRRPFGSAGPKRPACVVWLVSEEAISGVANALKELLEKNTLQGDMVVPAGSHGVLLLVSPKGRDELKETLPHRVVHMLSPLTLTAVL